MFLFLSFLLLEPSPIFLLDWNIIADGLYAREKRLYYDVDHVFLVQIAGSETAFP